MTAVRKRAWERITNRRVRTVSLTVSFIRCPVNCAVLAIRIWTLVNHCVLVHSPHVLRQAGFSVRGKASIIAAKAWLLCVSLDGTICTLSRGSVMVINQLWAKNSTIFKMRFLRILKWISSNFLPDFCEKLVALIMDGPSCSSYIWNPTPRLRGL